MFMTKCHYLIVLLAIVLAAGCRSQDKGPSLSEYSASSESVRVMKFAQYAAGLEEVPPEEAVRRQEARLDCADSVSFQEELKLQDRFFFNPDSPYRSEELMIPVFEKTLSSPYASQAQKSAAAYNLPLFKLNRVGSPAADFTFMVRGGRTRNLHGVEAAMTLLFFSNPGCGNCKEISDAVSGDPMIKEFISRGELAVVNIYPDENLEEWYGYSKDYPDEWICGYAPDIDEPAGGALPLYNVRAIPSLYLLDADKRVILKDAPVEKVISRICRR